MPAERAYPLKAPTGWSVVHAALRDADVRALCLVAGAFGDFDRDLTGAWSQPPTPLIAGRLLSSVLRRAEPADLAAEARSGPAVTALDGWSQVVAYLEQSDYQRLLGAVRACQPAMTAQALAGRLLSSVLRGSDPIDLAAELITTRRVA